MMAFDPMFCRVASSEPLEKARVLLGSVSTQVIVAFILVGAATILFANDIVRLMMHPKFSATAAVLPWLLAAGVAGVADGVGSIGAKYAKKVIWFVPVYLARGALVIGLDLLLVPHLGAVGAGIANFATAVVVMLLRFACSRAFWPVPLQLKRIALVVGAGTLVIVIGFHRPMGVGFYHKAAHVEYLCLVGHSIYGLDGVWAAPVGADQVGAHLALEPTALP
jgi:O-antigen/teichoic acid export membrane protein